MLASQTRAFQPSAARTSAFKPARIAPVCTSRVAPRIVCEAAAVDAPVAASKQGVAHLNYQRGSVFKVRRVLDTIRGRSYEEALILMEYMPYRACEKILKCLLSAAENAKHNQGASKSSLVVSEAFANQGPVMKRARPRAQGRAYKIMKPTFHLTIKVESQSA